jgi:uncharacterized protein
MMKRLQKNNIINDLREKYVFLAGPRQSGKTTLSKSLFAPDEVQYLNYDLAHDRQIITNGQWDRNVKLVILDEFHKFPTWKTFLKGYYDTEGNSPPILVTGSARLNVFRAGNDSMVGRYHYHRLLPFSVKELENKMKPDEALEALLKFGSFPEPFLKGSELAKKRWQKQYLERVVREDVTDLSNVRSLPKIQLLIDLLRERVGSQISYASLARDLEVASKTVKEWIALLEQLYIVFRITPYHKNIARSLLKEPKIYFFDPTLAFDSKNHLENLVAVSLLKHLWYLEDTQGNHCQLHYLRTRNGHEVDFLTVVDRAPKEMIEVKTSDQNFHKALFYFQKFLPKTKVIQIVQNLPKTKNQNTVEMKKVSTYLAGLGL